MNKDFVIATIENGDGELSVWWDEDDGTVSMGLRAVGEDGLPQIDVTVRELSDFYNALQDFLLSNRGALCLAKSEGQDVGVLGNG